MKIENESLYFKQDKGFLSKQMVEIKLTDVDTIYLGNEKYLCEVLNQRSISELRAFYSKYTSVAAHYGIRLSPVLIIVLKDGQTFVISTKPYSKKTFRILFHELAFKNVNIAVQKNLDFNY